MRPGVIALAFCLAVPCTMSAQVIIDIDAQQQGPAISPTHYGLFYEDINHAADGGLYAELIRNRSFEDGGTDSWEAVGSARIGVTFRQAGGTPRYPSCSSSCPRRTGLLRAP